MKFSSLAIATLAFGVAMNPIHATKLRNHRELQEYATFVSSYTLGSVGRPGGSVLVDDALFITDRHTNKIFKVNETTNTLIKDYGGDPSYCYEPNSIDFSAKTQTIWVVCNGGSKRLKQYDLDLNPMAQIALNNVRSPYGVAVDDANDVAYVAFEYEDSKVKKINLLSGSEIADYGHHGCGHNYPYTGCYAVDVKMDSSGHIWVCWRNFGVVQYDANWNILRTIQSGGGLIFSVGLDDQEQEVWISKHQAGVNTITIYSYDGTYKGQMASSFTQSGSEEINDIRVYPELETVYISEGQVSKRVSRWTRTAWAATDPPTPSPTDSFNWNITEANSFVNVKFSDARNGDEVQLNYHAADKQAGAQVLDYDNCNSTSGLNGAITASTIRNGTNLQVPLDINPSALATSDFYEVSDNNETGTIKVCVRVDLYADFDGDGNYAQDESVNFHESKLEIEIDMTNEFAITGVVTNRTEATETNKNTTLDYYVDAFECGAGAGGQYTQGGYLEICVGTNGTGVKVSNIIDMTLTGDTTFTSIDGSDDASESSLTERVCDDTASDGSAGCKVKTMLISGFFVNADPEPINVTGTAVMEFVRARRLSSFRRGLQDDDLTNEEFGLTIALEPMNIDATADGGIEMTDSAATASTAYFGMASFIVAVFSFFLM